MTLMWGEMLYFRWPDEDCTVILEPCDCAINCRPLATLIEVTATIALEFIVTFTVRCAGLSTVILVTTASLDPKPVITWPSMKFVFVPTTSTTLFPGESVAGKTAREGAAE